MTDSMEGRTGATELFRLERVGKQYHSDGCTIHALQDVSLSLHAGEILGLLGPNGAGKTTMIKLLACLLEPDNGQLYWRGAPVRNKRHLGQVGLAQEGRGALNERLSTLENARYFCNLRGERFDPAYCAELGALLEAADLRAPVCGANSAAYLALGLLLFAWMERRARRIGVRGHW